MISLCNKFCFIHVNKTGGTSITDELIDYREAQLCGDHDPAKYLRNVLGEDLWGEFFKFAFFRNPFDRMVSSYEYRVQFLGERHSSFKDWMMNVVKKDPLDREWSNQLWMVEDNDKQIIVDKIYLYEDLQAGFDDACFNIGIEQKDLPFSNKTTRGDWRDYYCEETADLVSKRFARDLAWNKDWERP